MKWLLVLLVLFGSYLHCYKDWRGFLFCIAAESAFSVLCALEGDYAECFIFGLYAIFACLGLYVWRKKEVKE